MRPRFRLLLILLAVAPNTGPGGTPQEEFSFDEYRSLIEVYRSGEFEWAVEALAEAPLPVVERFAERLREFAHKKGAQFPRLSVPSMDLQAAVLLHTQVAVMKANEREVATEQAHWEAARVIFRGIHEHGFRREWLLARGYFHQTRLEETEAVAVLKTALFESPKDSEILLALGTVYEAHGGLVVRRLGSMSPPTPPLSGAREKALRERDFLKRAARQDLNRAREYYEKALDVKPGFVEAHLRLGRVLQLLGRSSDALARFDWVLDHGREPSDLCVAHLFSGRLHEQEGHLDDAVEHFRAAVEVRSDWQVPFMALSHVLHLAGDVEGSLAAVKKGLELPFDPDYPGGGLWDYTLKRDEFVNRILGLREEVVQ